MTPVFSYHTTFQYLLGGTWEKMLKCMFGQVQCIMSNQVGVNTCRDDQNEYISMEAGFYCK